MSVIDAPRPAIESDSRAALPPTPAPRLLSLDVYRGVIMVSLICFGFGLRTFKDDQRWKFLANQVEHSEWTGVVFWDLIKPGFMFMVGVAMPFAFARRKAMGASYRELFFHALRRSFSLILLGIFITCITDGRISIEFRRVLQQIAVGYLICFFLVDRSYLVQGLAAAAILIGYTL